MGGGLATAVETVRFLGRVAKVAAQAAIRRIAGPRDAEPRTLLLLSWGFPPNYSTGAVIPAEIALAAARRGWRVAVVTAPIAPADGRHHRMRMPPFPATVAILRPDLAIDVNERPVRRPAWRLFRAVHGGVDVAVLMARIALTRSPFGKPAIVLSSGPDFAGFAAAAMLRLAYGRGSRIVLQYRDEWTVEVPPFVQVHPESRWWERMCLKAADAITFVTPGKLAAYRRAFPFLDGKRLYVHRNGVAQAAGEAPPRRTLPAADGRLRLLFAGRFAEPAHLFPLLADLRALRAEDPEAARTIHLTVLGNQGDGFKQALNAFAAEAPDMLTLRGYVEPALVPAIIGESDALLLVCNARYDGWVPLKLFDYMAGSQAILAYGTTSEAAAIVRATGTGLVAPSGQPRALAEAVVQLRRAGPGTWDTAARRAWAAANDRARILDDLVDQLEAISTPPAAADGGQVGEGGQARHGARLAGRAYEPASQGSVEP